MSPPLLLVTCGAFCPAVHSLLHMAHNHTAIFNVCVWVCVCVCVCFTACLHSEHVTPDIFQLSYVTLIPLTLSLFLSLFFSLSVCLSVCLSHDARKQ